MTKTSNKDCSSTITLNGVTYKTNGNIVFDGQLEDEYFIAESTTLDNIDSYLEHGMQTLLKKVKT